MKIFHSLALLFCLTFSASVLVGQENQTALVSSSTSEASTVSGLHVLPRQVSIYGADRWQRVVVQAQLANGILGKELPSSEIQWSIADPKIAKFEGDRVIPVSDGETTLVARWSSPEGRALEDSVPIRITACNISGEWEFGNHVQAVLARAGCNSGACHGALAGKGGFRLSLRGYDSAADHFTITRQDRGRRIELADPGLSLLLTKPSEIVPHKGGLKLPVDSHNFKVLADWIAAGALPSSQDEAKLEKVEVLPSQVELQPDTTQQMLVLAHYDNGRIEDVTHWAKFSATDESVCQVDEQGKVKVLGYGEGSVSVWFASRIVLARVVVPYPNKVNETEYSVLKSESFIDQHVLNQLESLNLAPSQLADDYEFVRRIYLDTIGVLPTADEVKAYVENRDESKKSKLIEQLLARPEFVDYWAYKWSDVLMINGTLLRPDAVKAYYTWIREHVSKNTPWDQLVREIITAKGNSLEQGATNFYALNQDPEGMTENACQAFLALSIGCAKCHNHPLEKWTNDQYYAMANMFARVRAKGWGGDSRNGDGKRTIVVLERGDLIQPSTGKPQPPAPLDSAPMDASSTADRREYLATWMTAPDNPYFTKAVVNRVWANFFGIGLVQPVDDLRVSNPASNPELFNALAAHLQEHQYDLKQLMRTILSSQTYALSSQARKENESDRKFFSHYYPKRLMAEVLHDAICQATAVPTKFEQIEFPGSDFAKTDFYPEGTRAIQLYDSAVASYFLKTFGRNQRRITCECERSDESSVVQVLHISNGSTVNEKLSSEKGVVQQWMAQAWEPGQLVDQAFLRTVSRPPSYEEREKLVKELEAVGSEERRQAVEDMLWSLLSSREFLFNR